ncbi:urea transporter [Oceanimonas marisflavi]|uniref:urea transporter n=1 Tax=Oceanimonas marisflavi TaxID=2059724 RepID=UPI000D31E1B9|nr:urea transporter [Oceanimonas marisflavi]
MALLSSLLAAIGQIYFINNRLAGALIVAGVIWASPWMAATMMLATLAATLLALACKWEPEARRDGLFGFNAALVGLAFGLFAEHTPFWLLMSALGGMLSAWLFYRLRRLAAIPWYTLPFNLVVLPWLYFIGQRVADEVPQGYNFSLSAIGQVIFLPDMVPAVLICAALLLVGIEMLGWAFVGAMVSSGAALLLLVNPDYINFGLTGYNGVLAAIAMFWGGHKQIWILLAPALAGLMTAAMLKLGLPMLTMPFVLSCWLCLALQKGLCYYRCANSTDREKV